MKMPGPNNTFDLLNPDSDRPIVLSAEHAGKRIPKKYGTLGTTWREIRKSPDYCDVGIDELSRAIAKELKARCIVPKISRMILNLNKPPEHARLINPLIFGVTVPDNICISKTERKYRITQFYRPYHTRLEKEIGISKKKHKRTFYISIHSFFHKTPKITRALDIGILYRFKKDLKFCKSIERYLKKKTKFRIAYNEPYSAFETAGYTLEKYGNSRKITCMEFEVNDKHLRTRNNIKMMAKLLSEAIEHAIVHEIMHEIVHETGSKQSGLKRGRIS